MEQQKIKESRKKPTARARAAEPFEKASDENLILFFREEIKKIDEGEKATDLLSVRVTKRLLELGILARTWQNTLILGEKGRHVTSSPH